MPSSTGGEGRVIHGPSGIGKSALVGRVLREFAAPPVSSLSGRCYENESVPYKALDGLIDDLSRYLSWIPSQDVEELMPPDVAELTRVFPVMLQVHAIANTPADRRREAPTLSISAGERSSAARAAGATGASPASGDRNRRPAVGRRR
jgi:hypothetical protein